MSKALFVALEAQPGRGEEIAEFLRAALGPVQEEPETRNWYAVRFNDTHFAIFDTFPGGAGQIKHLLGKVGRALMLKSFTALESVPDIESAELIAAKPFTQGPAPALALYVPLRARDGKAQALANHLKAAAAMVADEPGTSAWYALDLGGGHFATFNVFPGKPARDAHLAGDVTGALVGRAADLLAHPPELKGGEVLAAKLWA
jgi:quinol monooxygenase YgiN